MHANKLPKAMWSVKYRQFLNYIDVKKNEYHIVHLFGIVHCNLRWA